LARFGAGITGAIELIALRWALPQGADQTAPAAPIAINILSYERSRDAMPAGSKRRAAGTSKDEARAD
jgi:hypothetical protein